MFNNRKIRGLRLFSPDTPSLFEVLASIDEPPRHLPANSSFRATPFFNHDLGIRARGATTFDYLDNTLRISPRDVVKMDWYSERDSSRHEYIVLKVTDRVHRKDVWIRFLPYSEDNIGDYAYTEAAMIPANADLSASFHFETPVQYSNILETRHEMRKSLQDRNSKANRYAHASRFVEMLSTTVGQGVGRCSSLDLCKIWSTQPDSHRRLRAFCWYISEISGLEYIVLDFVATLDFKTDQGWWVRLERENASDMAFMSGSRDSIVLGGSVLKHRMTFQNGVPFEHVRDVLYDTPAVDPDAIDDTWQYASQLAYRLSMKVEDGLGECSVQDLCEMWSVHDTPSLLVNRALCYQGTREGEAEYVLINVSKTLQLQGRRGLWARLEYNAASAGVELDWASISQNRRRLQAHESNLIADRKFEGLEFKKIESIIRPRRSNKQLNSLPSRPSMVEILPAFSKLSDHAGQLQVSAPQITSIMVIIGYRLVLTSLILLLTIRHCQR
ncbi:hypothetical protein BDV93DRAFT_192866 [Ceratobasidium sp. AG-I]|nr:hypothetical protein BDV93DRAFT_192866 [Ceratobasidium sp. AG-I]